MKTFVFHTEAAWAHDMLAQLAVKLDVEVVSSDKSGVVAVIYNTNRDEIRRALSPYAGGVIHEIRS